MSIMLENLEMPVGSKGEAIVRAGFDVFLNYGFKRATMDDIAQAAGMSRPALYLVYKNKKDIFRACISAMTLELQGRLDEICSRECAAEEAVYDVLKAGILDPYVMIGSARAEEIFDIKSELAPDLFDEWMRRLETAIRTILEGAADRRELDFHGAGLEARRVAALVVDGAEGVKLRIADAEDLAVKLKALTHLMLRSLAR